VIAIENFQTHLVLKSGMPLPLKDLCFLCRFFLFSIAKVIAFEEFYQ